MRESRRSRPAGFHAAVFVLLRLHGHETDDLKGAVMRASWATRQSSAARQQGGGRRFELIGRTRPVVRSQLDRAKVGNVPTSAPWADSLCRPAANLEQWEAIFNGTRHGAKFSSAWHACLRPNTCSIAKSTARRPESHTRAGKPAGGVICPARTILAH